MGKVLSEILAAIDRLTFLWFTAKFRKSTVISGVQEGGFTQKIHIYSRQDPKVIKRGTVLIDPGNYGPNLITDDAMRYVHGQPAGSGQTIRTYDGDEKKVGGEVELCFSGPGPKIRYYTETFCHVPCIVDGIDMVLNHDFYIAVYPDKVPPMLMIRKAGKKESEAGGRASRRTSSSGGKETI
ncbi:hypothetical protein CJF30_00011237 [Rutstroemia sp. NJR-2017a BBW]|nr:hypothetical protein CJF30_00011237 [Rutstroemia sp. NJR-2017a BBW]